MNVVDVLIIIFLIFGIFIGFKRGFTRQLVSLVAIFMILILSFLLKNPISVFLYNNLPFFNFGGVFKDITVLNILLYETIAFFIIFFLLTIIFRILIKITKIFEHFLTLTIILGIPSKLLGALFGFIESIIYIFIILYILRLPTFNIDIVNKSKFGNIILDKTPILTDICDSSLSVFNEIVELKDEYEHTNNVQEFNQKALNSMIDKGIITKENAQKLIKKGKIKNVIIN